MVPEIVVVSVNAVFIILADTRPGCFIQAHKITELDIHVFPAKLIFVAAVGVAVVHIDHRLDIYRLAS